jgi:uncharacterized protein YkwD
MVTSSSLNHSESQQKESIVKLNIEKTTGSDAVVKFGARRGAFITSVLATVLASTLVACGGGASDGGSVSAPTTQTTTQSAAASPQSYTCGIANFSEEFTARINSLRTSGAICGGVAMPPVGRLLWSDRLQSASAAHARNMAELNFLSHTGLDGSTAFTRAQNAGYIKNDGSFLEFLAIRSQTIEQVVAGWVAKPEECKALMATNWGQADFIHLGVGCADNPSSAHGRYWVLNYGVDSY